MKFIQPLIVATLVATLLSITQANADFLGLAPGDYTVPVPNTTSYCGGSNCTGTIHIGASGATGFSWNFMSLSPTFLWDGPSTFTAISPNGLNSCAIEGPAGTDCGATDTATFASLPGTPYLFLTYVNAHTVVIARVSDSSDRIYEVGWTAAPLRVPEPMSGILFLIGISALGWRRRYASGT
jgi:hypothetical protein